jgi:hypothetical protein
MLPAKLGAKDEEEGGTPALLVATGKLKSKMPPKLGAEPGDEEDTSEEALDPAQACMDAAKDIAACLNVSPSVAKRLNAALTAHHRAVDTMDEENE